MVSAPMPEAPLLRTDYPAQTDGTTWLPFRRVFAVAHKS